MFRIVILEISKKGNIDQISNYLISWTKDWKKTAQEEYKNYKSGSRKEILVYEKDKMIYHHKNYRN